MSIDLDKPICRTETNRSRFGICDPGGGAPAQLQFDTDEAAWNACVRNDRCRHIRFTAIDNCIDLRREDGNMAQRCDGMLTCDDQLVLIELKDVRHGWKMEGLAQIEATVLRLMADEAQFYAGFRRRTAMIANRSHRHPKFEMSDKALRQQWYQRYKLHLQFDIEIVV